MPTAARTPAKRAPANKTSRQQRERRAAFPPNVPRAQKRTVGRSTTRETPLHVRARGVDLDDATREYVRGRTGFKLGKYALHLTRISVRIEDAGGSRGAPAYSCRVKVVLPGTSEVVVAATESSARAAFDVAADAAERAVRRLLGRVQGTRRRAPTA